MTDPLYVKAEKVMDKVLDPNTLKPTDNLGDPKHWTNGKWGQIVIVAFVAVWVVSGIAKLLK